MGGVALLGWITHLACVALFSRENKQHLTRDINTAGGRLDDAALKSIEKITLASLAGLSSGIATSDMTFVAHINDTTVATLQEELGVCHINRRIIRQLVILVLTAPGSPLLEEEVTHLLPGSTFSLSMWLHLIFKKELDLKDDKGNLLSIRARSQAVERRLMDEHLNMEALKPSSSKGLSKLAQFRQHGFPDTADICRNSLAWEQARALLSVVMV